MRRESGNVRYFWFTGSARSRSLNLYLTGFWENCPSTSDPVHSMRTEGDTAAASSLLGMGFRICTVGATVNEKNARNLRGDSAPLLSTALITNTWKSDAVGGLVPMMLSGWDARKKRISSFFLVLIHTESVAVGSMQYS